MSTATLLDSARKLKTFSKKVTASLPSRKAAKIALLELRKAGYTHREVQVLPGVTSSVLQRGGLRTTVSRYMRHLVGPKRVLIRVTAPDIEPAALLFRNLGAEVAIDHFFHQNTTPAKSAGGSLLPLRRWSE